MRYVSQSLHRKGRNAPSVLAKFLGCSPILRTLRPSLLIPQYNRHHPRRRRVERRPEIEARLHTGRPFDRRLGQRLVDLVQRDGHAAVGIDGEGHGDQNYQCGWRQQRYFAVYPRSWP